MIPRYTVVVDVERSLLRLTMAGFFDIATVTAMATARNAALRRLRCGPNRHVTICDAREAMLSTAEVNAAFRRLLGDPRYASRRLAYLTNLALGRIQAARVLARDNVGYFTDTASAEAWLFADDDASAVRADAIP